MIRKLTLGEVPMCVPLGQDFWKEADVHGKFDGDSFTAFWQNMLQLDMGVIFGLFRGDEFLGGFGGIVIPDPMTSDLTAMEQFWFLSPEHRGSGGLKLLNAFERWAKEKSAARIFLVHLLAQQMEPERMERLYRRLGFEPFETFYNKEVTR